MFTLVLGFLAVLALLWVPLRWTYRVEKRLQYPWLQRGGQGQIHIRASLRCEDGQWQSFTFPMPIHELERLFGLGKEVKSSSERA
jgi:hypothetical protein